MNNVLKFPARPGRDQARLQQIKIRIQQIFSDFREPELQALRQRVAHLEEILNASTLQGQKPAEITSRRDKR